MYGEHFDDMLVTSVTFITEQLDVAPLNFCNFFQKEGRQMKWQRLFIIGLFCFMVSLVATMLHASITFENTGKQYALLVGVDEYESGSISGLQYAAADAKELGESLTNIGFPRDNVIIMASGLSMKQRPSKERILKAFDELLGKLNEKDSIVVMFSGHGHAGHSIVGDGKAVFIPEDAKRDGLELSGVIELEDILAKLNESKATEKFLICDFIGSDKIDITSSNVSVLLACGGSGTSEVALDAPERKHGVLTYYVLEGLKGKAAVDGTVTVSGLCKYVQDATIKYTKKKFDTIQHPKYHVADDFIIFKGNRYPK